MVKEVDPQLTGTWFNVGSLQLLPRKQMRMYSRRNIHSVMWNTSLKLAAVSGAQKPVVGSTGIGWVFPVLCTLLIPTRSVVPVFDQKT
jgi:hypothetical protein